MYSRILIILTILAVLISAAPTTRVDAAATVIHVATTGAQSGACGSTWASPCGLQHALKDMAVSGDELWVKAGTYTPTTDANRSATFQLKTGVALYGGFAGTETTRDQRNWVINRVTLSGDLGSTHVYHIVTGSGTDNTAILDGFTITGGQANGSGPEEDYGGGVYNSFGSPLFQNVILNNNSATTSGGGMYNNHSDPRLLDVVFSDNSVTAGYGGAMTNSYSTPYLLNVTFSDNAVTDGGGGAMYNDQSSPTLVNGTFVNNSASGGNGGAMYNDLIASPVMTNVTFSNNSALMNAGYNGGYGGAIYNYATTYPPQLTHVTFSGNRAVGYDENHPAQGGAIYVTDGGGINLANTILWGNSPDQLYTASNQPLLNTSVVEGGCPTGVTCTAISAADPRLGTLGNYGGSVQTIPLLPQSSAIDTANDSQCPATDARGVARPIGPHCDIGAFEATLFKMVYLPLIIK
jgi:hypothetical protein